MTETRKKIIELISPYMDNMLSEGCLIQDENWEIYKFLKMCESWWSFDTIWIGKSFNRFYYPMKSNKILWHYDLSAVLKCIYTECEKRKGSTSFSWDSFWVEIYRDGDEYIEEDEEYIEDEYLHFPNKPLHLYTEEEDKNLLEILLKLKNEN